MPSFGVAWWRSSWWDDWRFAGAVALLCAVPLLLPGFPPLVDLPGHIGRYRIQLDLASSESLQRYYDFDWSIIGNLGVDLLVIPLEPLFGLELAVKLIVLTIPVLTASGIFWTSREVHGHVPPTTLFAIPFVYGYPFNFGFLNFSLSMALALLALALWIRLGRLGRTRLRAAVFVPLSCAIWLVHAFGWGVLGLAAWSAELVRQRDRGLSWIHSALRAAAHILVLSIPLILMVLWRSGDAAGVTRGYFQILYKAFALVAVMRDRWLVWDSFGLAVAIVILGVACIDRRFEFARKLGVTAAVLAAIYFLLPRSLFGSAYADMRLAPLMLIVLIVAIRIGVDQSERLKRNIALLGLLFILLRLGGNMVSFAIAHGEAEERLAALDHVPNGARVLFLAGDHCDGSWAMPRYIHLGAFVITRRLGFTNDQWQIPGAQLLRVDYPAGRDFVSDPTMIVYEEDCLAEARLTHRVSRLTRTSEEAVAQFPREAFDYVWLIRPPGFEMTNRPGLLPVWRGRDSILYRVVGRGPDRA